MWIVKQFSLAIPPPPRLTHTVGCRDVLWAQRCAWLCTVGAAWPCSLALQIEPLFQVIPLVASGSWGPDSYVHTTTFLLAMPSSLSFSPESGLYHFPWCLVLWFQSLYTGCFSDIQEIRGWDREEGERRVPGAFPSRVLQIPPLGLAISGATSHLSSTSLPTG